MNEHRTPELLAPAGNLEKLKTAVLYGADAVYLAGRAFGLRAAGDNFTEEEIAEGVRFAHERGAKVHVAMNGILHDKDLAGLPGFVRAVSAAGADAAIVADLGAMEVVRRESALPVHLSTQASCLNAAAARFWRRAGVSRVILGREAGIDEARAIKESSGLEVEMFVHGSLCSAYSGRCVISNFTRGRDSNRGGCAHSCRLEFSLDLSRAGGPSDARSFFMSSKDLRGLGLLPRLVEAGIDSLKIEGRAKSLHYVATTTGAYARALRLHRESGRVPDDALAAIGAELSKAASRGATEGSLLAPAGSSSVHDGREGDPGRAGLGVVLETSGDSLLVRVSHPFEEGDRAELLPFSGEPVGLVLEPVRAFDGGRLRRALPGSLVSIPSVPDAAPLNVLRAGASAGAP